MCGRAIPCWQEPSCQRLAVKWVTSSQTARRRISRLVVLIGSVNQLVLIFETQIVMHHPTVRWFWNNWRVRKDVASASLIQISASKLCKYFSFFHTSHMLILSHPPWQYLMRGSDRDVPYRASLSTPFSSILTLQMSLTYSYLFSYLLTYSLYTAETFLRS